MSEAQRSTLFGVATGTPDGGVAVVRVSGPEAERIARRLVGDVPPARRLVRRRIALAEGYEDGLVAWMPGPASFTGEDVLELHVHAGARNVEAVCAAVAACDAVAAGPGDFSRRAFELGRLSLDEAEGVAAVIGARTDAALRQARRLASGELGRQVEALRERVIGLVAEVEANLDFPEDVEPAAVARWREELTAFARELDDWLARFEAGRRARSLPRVVLGGPVNAGKSSLFNALLGRPRALTAAEPGTTRDYVEAELEIEGFACMLVDTAGLRETEGAVEAAGIVRSNEQLEAADIVLWAEPSDAPDAERPALAGRTVIEVETKRDLGVRRSEWAGASVEDLEVAEVAEVREALRAWFAAGVDAPWIGLERHRARAGQARDAVAEATLMLAGDDRLELGAFALGVAAQRLGEITGRSATGPVGEEVLTEIFARFCIGK